MAAVGGGGRHLWEVDSSNSKPLHSAVRSASCLSQSVYSRLHFLISFHHRRWSLHHLITAFLSCQQQRSLGQARLIFMITSSNFSSCDTCILYSYRRLWRTFVQMVRRWKRGKEGACHRRCQPGHWVRQLQSSRHFFQGLKTSPLDQRDNKERRLLIFRPEKIANHFRSPELTAPLSL